MAATLSTASAPSTARSALHVLRLVENAHSLGRAATLRLALLRAGVGVRLARGGAAEPLPFSMPEWPTFGTPASDATCAGGWLAPAPLPSELVRPPEPMASGVSARSAGAAASSGSSAPASTPPGNPEVAAVLGALEAWKLTAACSVGLAPLWPRALVRAPLDKLTARQYAIASMVLESRPGQTRVASSRSASASLRTPCGVEPPALRWIECDAVIGTGRARGIGQDRQCTSVRRED